MEFKLLPDEEFNDCKKIDVSEKSDFSKKHLTKICNTKKSLKEAEERLDIISEMIENKQLQFIGIESSEVISRLNRCINNINAVIRNIGIKKEVQQEAVGLAKLQFEKTEEDILRIIFPELLPERKSADEKGFATTIWRIQEQYKNAILKYFSESEHKVYEEKVVLCFIHHFCEERDSEERDSKGTIKDHDNFETKAIIDCLASCLFVDDSAKYCSHFMDYLLDAKEDEEYSEIYILPQKKFYNFIINKEEL